MTTAPRSRADFWFLVSQGLLGILLLAGGWTISQLMDQVDTLADTVNSIDGQQTEKRLRLEMKLNGELAELRTDVNVLQAKEQ